MPSDVEWQQQKSDERKQRKAEKQSERTEWTRKAKQAQNVTTTNDGLPIYHYYAMHDSVCVKWSDDPRTERVAQSACTPGTMFCSTGTEWWGTNGDHWIDGFTLAKDKPHWLLLER